MTDDNDDLEEPAGPNRTVLIVAGVSVIALTLALVLLRAARAQKPPAVTAENPGIVDGDWRASLEHLAAAFDMRCQGLDTRLEQLAESIVMMNAGNAPSVPAAVSLPTPTIVEHDADLMQPPPQPQVGALEPPPPSPAAVSM